MTIRASYQDEMTAALFKTESSFCLISRLPIDGNITAFPFMLLLILTLAMYLQQKKKGDGIVKAKEHKFLRRKLPQCCILLDRAQLSNFFLLS